MKKTLFLLFIVSVFFIYSQENPKIDKLKQEIRIPKTINEKIKLYGDIIWEYKETNLDSAFVYVHKAFSLVDEKTDAPIKAQLYSDVAGVYMLKGNFKKCQQSYLQSLSIRIKQKDTVGIGKIRANLAAVYTKYGKQNSAMANAMIAMKIFEKKGYNSYANILKSNVATIHESISN